MRGEGICVCIGSGRMQRGNGRREDREGSTATDEVGNGTDRVGNRIIERTITGGSLGGSYDGGGCCWPPKKPGGEGWHDSGKASETGSRECCLAVHKDEKRERRDRRGRTTCTKTTECEKYDMRTPLGPPWGPPGP